MWLVYRDICIDSCALSENRVSVAPRLLLLRAQPERNYSLVPRAQYEWFMPYWLNTHRKCQQNLYNPLGLIR